MKNSFMGHLLSIINKLCKGGKTMEEKDKPKKPVTPSDLAKSDDKSKEEPKDTDVPKFDENGHLFIDLSIDDSALVVRNDGSIELISHDLENSDEGYVGDVEDLNKTFSLVLALASALENEDLYNRIFHNLNMTLMRKWDNMPDNIKNDIIEKRSKKTIASLKESMKEHSLAVKLAETKMELRKLKSSQRKLKMFYKKRQGVLVSQHKLLHNKLKEKNKVVEE